MTRCEDSFLWFREFLGTWTGDGELTSDLESHGQMHIADFRVQAGRPRERGHAS